MRPLSIAIEGKGLREFLHRGLRIGQRYGVTPARIDDALAEFLRTMDAFAGQITIPITGVVLARHAAVVRRYQSQGVEFALHGFRHVDHSRLSLARQIRHLELSRQTLARCGIEAHGFRSPYLRRNPETLMALRHQGFAYDSSQALHWPVLNDAAPPSYGRALRFYSARSAADLPSVPNLHDGLVEIPYNLPDDEALIERWSLRTPEQIAAVWSSILRRSHDHGELFTLGLHPERILACREALATVLAEARRSVPPIWIARLNDIATWWRARISTQVEIGEVGNKVHLTVTGPPQLTILTRAVQVEVPTTPWDDHYRKVAARRVTIDSPCRPFIGLSPTTSPKLTDYLWQQGYLTLTGAGAEQCTHYFDRPEFNEWQRRCVLDQIERSDRPLVRLGRWPNGARSALAISGDIDALTLWDYGLRLLQR